MTYYEQKILNQNGESLCLQSSKFVTSGLVKMVKGNKLCLVFVKYVISFENIRRFVLVPSPPMKMILFSDFSLIISGFPSTEMMYQIMLTS